MHITYDHNTSKYEAYISDFNHDAKIPIRQDFTEHGTLRNRTYPKLAVEPAFLLQALLLVAFEVCHGIDCVTLSDLSGPVCTEIGEDGTFTHRHLEHHKAIIGKDEESFYRRQGFKRFGDYSLMAGAIEATEIEATEQLENREDKLNSQCAAKLPVCNGESFDSCMRRLEQEKNCKSQYELHTCGQNYVPVQVEMKMERWMYDNKYKPTHPDRVFGYRKTQNGPTVHIDLTLERCHRHRSISMLKDVDTDPSVAYIV